MSTSLQAIRCPHNTAQRSHRGLEWNFLIAPATIIAKNLSTGTSVDSLVRSRTRRFRLAHNVHTSTATAGIRSRSDKWGDAPLSPLANIFASATAETYTKGNFCKTEHCVTHTAQPRTTYLNESTDNAHVDSQHNGIAAGERRKLNELLNEFAYALLVAGANDERRPCDDHDYTNA